VCTLAETVQQMHDADQQLDAFDGRRSLEEVSIRQHIRNTVFISQNMFIN